MKTSQHLQPCKNTWKKAMNQKKQRADDSSEEENEEGQVSEKVRAEKNESMKITMCEKQYYFKLNNNNVCVLFSTNSYFDNEFQIGKVWS